MSVRQEVCSKMPAITNAFANCVGNTKHDIRGCTSVMWKPVPGQKDLGLLTTFGDIRNASINKSLIGGRRYYISALGRTVLDGIRDGPGLIIFASILPGCIVVKTRMNC